MRTVSLFIALLALSASLCLAAGPVDMNSAQAKGLLAKNGKTFLLDVRTPDEYRQAHLRGALLIPLGELERRVREVPKDRPVLVYCAVGARSSSAASFLGSKGYREIYNMSDGIVGWYRNGFPIERGK